MESGDLGLEPANLGQGRRGVAFGARVLLRTGEGQEGERGEHGHGRLLGFAD